MNKTNIDIKTKAKENNVFLWQIAYELGVTDSTFSKKLRVELSPEEKEKIFAIIENLSK